ncbi:hypothetical protein [Pararobbsia alpina]|uniref:hypothetical protein n=1 Tax=Pararobbsia alpina TaxID=621374 RepID=UPI001583CDA2|nr:hypothetical protein [Pararobbsia alpina]
MTTHDLIKRLRAQETVDGTPQEIEQITDEAADAIEILQREREAILMQARIWAQEAKTQKSTVDEVGAILGGIPDWGPIAAGVEALQRDAARYRWLKDNCFDWAAPGDGDSFDYIALHFEHELLGRDDSTVDAAIDAALSATNAKERG